MKVLILGCGYTGSYLARFLIGQGIPVAVTTRQGVPPKQVDAPCYAFRYETIGELTSLPPEALEGVSHVLSTIPPDRQGSDPVAACLLSALEQAELNWFGYLSTTGVYGDAQGAWVDETTPVNPQTERSQHRVDAESAFLNSQIPSHIFRLPGIYGPGRSTFDRLRAGTAKPIDNPGHVFSRIHVEDVVRTLWASMQQPNPKAIYNVADDEPTEPSHLIIETAHLLGVTPPESIPLDRANLSPMSASFWSECRRVTNQKIKAELGVILKYSTYREGLKAILQAEQTNTAPFDFLQNSTSAS